jgi:hypothetical protein
MDGPSNCLSMKLVSMAALKCRLKQLKESRGRNIFPELLVKDGSSSFIQLTLKQQM